MALVRHEVVPQRRVHVPRGRRLEPAAPQALDGADHLGVVAHARAEGEVPAAARPERLPQTHGPAPVLQQRLQHRARGLHRIVRQSERPREDVRAPAGDHHQSGPPAAGVPLAATGPDLGREQSVHRLVDRAVPTEHGHDVVALGVGGPGQTGGVAPIPGLFDRKVHRRPERTSQHIPRTTVRRGRLRIDQEHGTHIATLTRLPTVPKASRPPQPPRAPRAHRPAPAREASRTGRRSPSRSPQEPRRALYVAAIYVDCSYIERGDGFEGRR